jgi:hypothetical protein
MAHVEVAEFEPISVTAQLRQAQAGESLVFPCDPSKVHQLNKSIQVTANNLGIRFKTQSFTALSNAAPRVACGFLVLTVLTPYVEDAPNAEPPAYTTEQELLIRAMPLETKAMVGRRMLTYGLPHYAVKSILGLSDRAHAALLSKKRKKPCALSPDS